MKRLGKEEVAKKIGVEVRKLEYMVSDKEFPPGVKIGKGIWWLEEVADAWLDLKFGAQKDWVSRARDAIGQRGEEAGRASAVAPIPSAIEQSPSIEPVAQGSMISTALKAAGVPAPVRLA